MAKAQKTKTKVEYLTFSIFLALVTISFLPNLMDPFILPKSAILVVGSIWFALNSIKPRVKLVLRPLNVTLLALILWLLILVVASDYKWISLFGVNGRATGILFYTALIGLLWHAQKFSFEKQEKIFLTFLVVSTFILFYGVLQFANLDPFEWNLVYEGIIGVFGNPNFMGAFSALAGIAGFSLFLNREFKTIFKLLGLAIFALAIINILASKATQGFVSLVIGISPFVIFELFRSSKKLGLTGIGAAAFGLLLFVLGLLQKGPLAEIVYKQSVSYRGDFWRTATNMIKENPIFGVGFERFGVNYRNYRDLPQVLRNGVDAYSDNAHNIYLHFAATGGIVLAFLYLILNVLVVSAFIQKIRFRRDQIYFYITVFSIWIAIQAQSLISIDTPGMAIWGWVFAGFLLSNPDSPTLITKDISPMKIVAALGAMAFAVLSIFQINAQSSMRTAFYAQIPKNNVEYAEAKSEILQKAENHEPLNAEWPILSANSLFQDEAYAQAEAAAIRAVEKDPKDYRGWFFLASSQEKQSKFAEAVKSREAARTIDPFNADNLLELGRDYKLTQRLGEAKKIILAIKEFAPESVQYQNAVKEFS